MPRSSNILFEHIVNISVPRGRGGSGGGGGGGLQGFLQGQNGAALFEQIVDIPVPGGSFHDLHPDPGSAASSAVSRDEAFQWVFHTFLRSKKVRRRP